MSDPNFPGFIEDDAPAKPAPKAPAPKAPAPKAAAPGPSYQLDMGDPEPAPKKRYAPPPPVEETAPAVPLSAPEPAPAQRSRAPAAPVADTVPDEDIKPGARKDLWGCPHCGTKNQPQRTTCRTCTKSPDDEVIVPMFKRPPVIAGIAAGVVLLIALVVGLSGADLSLKDAGPEHADRALRSGGGAGAAREINGAMFTPKARVAVCGRVLACTSQNGVTSVVLALGADAKDDAAVAASSTAISDGRVKDAPEAALFLHLLFSGSAPALAKGAWFSLVGERGELAERPDLEGGTVIAVSDHRQ